MKYHITITDNETGEILHDHDTNLVIGAIGVEDGVNSLCITNCSGLRLLTGLVAAKKAVHKIEQGEPVLAQLSALGEKGDLDGLLDALAEEKDEPVQNEEGDDNA